LVKRPEMGDVVVREGQEPPEAVEVPVVRMAGGRTGVRFSRKLGAEPAQSAGSLVGERGDARPSHGGRGRPRLTGRARSLSLSETKGDQRDAALDDQEVDGDLADPPVVV